MIAVTTWEVEADKYETLLRKLFFTKTDALELACTLVGISGMADGGWDAVEESRNFLSDLVRVRTFAFPSQTFPSPSDTTARMCLLGYVHLVEMDAPYHLIVNLLRIHLGNRYHVDPFGDLKKRFSRKKKKPGLQQSIAPSPEKKIARIKHWADARRMPEVGLAFDDFYSADLRNAIAHSDYVLWRDQFRIAKPPGQSFTMAEIWKRIDRALGFYSAFFKLEIETRRVFADGKGQRMRLTDGDEVEFLIDDDGLLIGFRFYWSKGGTSECSRSREGRVARNLWFPNGEIEFLTGL